MAEMIYKLLVLGIDGEIIAETRACASAEAGVLADKYLIDGDVWAVAVYRYTRSLGCYTHCKTVFRGVTLANWRVEE